MNTPAATPAPLTPTQKRILIGASAGHLVDWLPQADRALECGALVRLGLLSDDAWKLTAAGRRVVGGLKGSLTPLARQAAVVKLLRDAGPLSVADIAAHLWMPLADAGQAVDRLQAFRTVGRYTAAARHNYKGHARYVVA